MFITPSAKFLRGVPKPVTTSTPFSKSVAPCHHEDVLPAPISANVPLNEVTINFVLSATRCAASSKLSTSANLVGYHLHPMRLEI